LKWFLQITLATNSLSSIFQLLPWGIQRMICLKWMNVIKQRPSVKDKYDVKWQCFKILPVHWIWYNVVQLRRKSDASF
jgi:hypothetical protein